MILLTSLMVKWSFSLIILFIGWWKLKGLLSKKVLVCFGILSILLSLVANLISGFVPPIKDQVTLRAQGEKCDSAKSSEVYLAGYTIDGVSFTSGKSLQIKDGHWFWSGENYAWRPETDYRQPEGITREIVLEIPVGWDRTLNFAGHQWRGIVEISTETDIYSLDTYSEKGSTISAQLGRSKTSALILNQIRQLVVYVLFLTFFTALLYKAIHIYIQDPNRSYIWFQNNSEKLVCFGIAFIAFGFMLHYADRTSLWNDEMFQVAFSNGSLFEALHFCLTTREASPPLFDLFATLWYRIAPYGEIWLLLPSIIAAAFSIYLAGLIGGKIYGKYGGVFSSVFCGCIPALWSNAAFEFRTYPFFILFSFVTFLCYIIRNEHLCYKNIILFGLSMTALAMSHYFGMIACASLFCSDVYLFYKKKVTSKVIFSYFIPGSFSAVWLIAVYCIATHYTGAKASVSWYGVPNIQSIKNLLQYLTGNYVLTYTLFLLGIAFVLTHLFNRPRSSFDWVMYYLDYAVISTLTLILGIYIYGHITTSKTTLWTNRYFLFLLPYVCIILTGTVYFFLLKSTSVQNGIKKAVCLATAMGLALDCLIGVRNTTAQPWRDAADWLYTQTNYIFNEDTVIINITGPECVEGWTDYYITRRGRRDNLHVESIWGLTQSELQSVIDSNSRVYVVFPHEGIPAWLETMLLEDYKLSEKNQNLKINTYLRQ